MSGIQLKGQVAIVTGGGRGLGRAFSLGLARAGASVALTARSADQVAETVRLVEEAGGRAIGIAADVTDHEAVKRAVQQIEQELGAVDLLVNNAGDGGKMGPIWEADADRWWSSVETNVRGPFLFCREVVPGMVARRRGRIVNIASGAGTRPIPYMSAYVTGKAALIRFSELLAAETQQHGLSVFAIQPGTVRTAMVSEILEDGVQWLPWFQDILDQGRDVTPEPATNLVLFLASGRADELTGRFFTVPDDPAKVVARADEVKREDLYTLRMRRLTW